MLSTLLGIDHFLKSQDFVDEESVCLGDFGKELLQLLDLLLGGGKLF